LRRLGLVTIGQSPRDDVVPELRRFLPPDVRIYEAGALDDLSPEEIAAHLPLSPERTLVTRLRDGTEVVVDAEFVHGRLQAVIERLGRGVDLIGLLCSGKFPDFESPVPLLVPHRLLRGVLSALLLPGPLGVLVPSPEQVGPAEEELRDWGIDAVVCATSPYRGDLRSALGEQVSFLRERGVAAVLLNCFGYGEASREFLQESLGVPVIAVRSLFARTLAELL